MRQIPVINGLTAYSHPCQIVADLMTFEEHKGTLAGQKLAWLGDGNNVAGRHLFMPPRKWILNCFGDAG